MRRTLMLLATLLLSAAATGWAQDPQEEQDKQAEPQGHDEAFDSPWRTSWFPVVTGRSNEWPVIGLWLRRWQPAPYEARTTFTGALSANVGATPQGSWYARTEFDAPLLFRPWRLTVGAAAAREARLGYFGLGNETDYDGDLVTNDQPYLYRVKRTRYLGYAQVSRYLTPHFIAVVSGGVTATDFATLPGPSIFKDDFGPGTHEENDVSARVALVYDSRDVEYNTHRGLLLEAGTQAGTSGPGYTRLYTVLRGYLPMREGTVVAARFGASGMGGSPTLDARFTVPAWDRPIPVLGGQYSHRALDTGRLTGKHVLFGNLEVRQDFLNFGDYGAVTLLGFVDAGRVFEGESFRLTTDGLKVGGGGGVALRLLRSTIVTLNFATGPDGFAVTFGNGWMF